MATMSRCRGSNHSLSRRTSLLLALLVLTAVATPAIAAEPSAVAAATASSPTRAIEEQVGATAAALQESVEGQAAESSGTVTETADSTATAGAAAAPLGSTAGATASGDTSAAAGGTSASASGSTVEAYLGGQEIATVGKTEANTAQDGSASSDATVLSLLGFGIVGSHAEADGGESSASTGAVLHAVCGVSGGSLCVSLLYGYAASTDDGDSSSSEAYSNLAGVCAGGDQDAPHESCDGALDVTVGESHSSADANRDSGVTAAERSSTLADACAGGRDSEGTCSGLGATVLSAQSADGGDAQTQGVTLEGGGEAHDVLPHPDAIPPGDCGADGSCIGFNDGATQLGQAGAPTAGDATGSSDRWATASAEGGVLRASVGGTEVVRAGATHAETNRDHSAASDATVLAVLGHEVIGAHSSAQNGSSQAETGYLTETCEASDGALCVALLYGYAASEDNASSSSAESDAVLASACAGGDRQGPTDSCDDGLDVEVGRSHSDASQDKSTASAEANQVSDGAIVCAGGHDEQTGNCSGVGATVLHAESHSAASPGHSDSASDSSILTIEAGGEEHVTIDSEGDISVPPGCPPGQSLVCITLNSDTDAGAGAGSGATAIDIAILPDEKGDAAGDGQGAWAQTTAAAGGPDREVVLEETIDPDEPRRDRPTTSRAVPRPAPDVPAAAPPGLAQTGLHLLVWLAVAVALVALGGVVVHRTRRASAC